jgi:hypothetical protein
MLCHPAGIFPVVDSAKARKCKDSYPPQRIRRGGQNDTLEELEHAYLPLNSKTPLSSHLSIYKTSLYLIK